MILLLKNVSTHKLTTISELRQMDKQTERVAVMLENKKKILDDIACKLSTDT